MKKFIALFCLILLMSANLIGCDKGTNTPVTSGDQQSAVTSESKDTVSTDDIITGTGTDDGAFNVDENSPASTPQITTSTFTSGPVTSSTASNVNSGNAVSSQPASSQTSSASGETPSVPAKGEFNTENKDYYERIPV